MHQVSQFITELKDFFEKYNTLKQQESILQEMITYILVIRWF